MSTAPRSPRTPVLPGRSRRARHSSSGRRVAPRARRPPPRSSPRGSRNRIARAAHAALKFLEELRVLVGHELPLVWSPAWRGRVGVIEVDPAATRISLGVVRKGGSLEGLESRVRFEGGSEPASDTRAMRWSARSRRLSFWQDGPSDRLAAIERKRSTKAGSGSALPVRLFSYVSAERRPIGEWCSICLGWSASLK